MNERSTHPIPLELASALLVPAAAYGFIRVFSETSAVTPLIGAALLSTAVSVLFRRVRVPLSIAAPLSLVFLVALIVNRFAPGTARLGLIPTSASIDQFQLLIDELVVNFQELRTPVPPLDAFVATAMIGVWVMAFLTDWGALRLRLAFEPVLPAALLFIFAAVLGPGAFRLRTTVVFAAAIAVWAVVQRSVNLAARNTWLTNDRRRGSLSIARTGAVIAAFALLAGVIVGPRLPGASAEEMISIRDQGEPTRVVVSPFVTLEARLVDQTDTELFTVASEQPSYWRLAGLDTYENDLWKVAGNFSPEDGTLPGQGQLGGQRDEVVQDYSITALSAIWLPGAFTPAAIDGATESVTWNAETSSLTVANDVTSSNGVQYTLTSLIPRFTAAELRNAPDTIPPEIQERYLQLPSVSPIVRDEALRVTADAPTRYDKMLALQEYFRAFDYSINLSPRVGDPIEQFLDERIGFCQQFAGTFAVMARLLGVPARIAIGFTWGDPIGATDDGRTIYRVTGRQTHAWPEVWFDGLGWVAFEPTPGRGAPSAVEYTEVPARQESLVQPNNPEGPVTTTTLAQTPAPGVNDEPQFPDDPVFDDPALDAGTDGGPFPWGTILRIMAVLAVIGAYLGGLPAWHWYRRDRRRKSATSPADGVETAWAEVSESLELGYGLVRRPSETRREFARRLASDMRVPREPMNGLAASATVARYHPGGLHPSDAERADGLAREIEASINQRVSLFNRWKRLIDPRRILRPTARVTAKPVLTLPGSAVDDPSMADESLNGHRPRELV
ncbi:MAG: DUF3488 and transglutaminase-like domain-containing protein [Actinomycetota bacterium]